MVHAKRTPCAKGIAIIPSITILRSDIERAKQLLRPELHHYLEESLAVSQWYPERDLQEIIIALGEFLRDKIPMDIWEFIGRQAALRALERKATVPTESGIKKGMYADAMQPGDGMRNLRKASTLWSLYHNTGQLRHEVINSQLVRISLSGFELTTEQFCRMHTGYIRQASALGAEVDVEQVVVEHVTCVRRGDAECAWDVTSSGVTYPREVEVDTDIHEAKQRMRAAIRYLEPRAKKPRKPMDT